MDEENDRDGGSVMLKERLCDQTQKDVLGLLSATIWTVMVPSYLVVLPGTAAN